MGKIQEAARAALVRCADAIKAAEATDLQASIKARLARGDFVTLNLQLFATTTVPPAGYSAKEVKKKEC